MIEVEVGSFVGSGGRKRSGSQSVAGGRNGHDTNFGFDLGGLMDSGATNSKLYEVLADAFRREGTDVLFTLMGDGNMHWASALSQLPGVKTVHVRHEHCAVAMAIGYYSATGRPGVASITCGPGVTQITTALASAVHGHVPIVVFAGEAPMNAAWHNQMIDQGPIVTASGATYIRAHSLRRMTDYVREAFFIARSERKPVVIGVPYDIQQNSIATLGAYQSSQSLLPQQLPTDPDPSVLCELAERLRVAERPVILAGRGALADTTRDALLDLAELSGALLATTLPARGLFDASSYSVGVSGGFATPVATQLLNESDMVLAFGARLTHHTTDGGTLFPKAFVAQVDEQPQGFLQGHAAADSYLRADANRAADAFISSLRTKGRNTPGYRTADVQERLKRIFVDDVEFRVDEGTLDPRDVVAALDRTIPKDWDIVSGSGHSSYFYTNMRDRRPANFHVIREFGAIGNGISIATGIAATKGTGKVVLLEGDGSLIMHIQELETIRRHGIRLLICALNDGAYGAEIHKLKADGVDESGAIFGRPDFGSIARGFDLRGNRIENLSTLEDHFGAYDAGDRAEIWDFPISRNVVSPRMRNFNARKKH